VRIAWVITVAVGALALASAASANDFQTVYREYKRTGTIKPCKFSDRQLRNAEQQTPPDVEQYAPSFLDALQYAREHASSCHKKAAAAPPAATPPPTATTPAPTPSATTPAPVPTAPATTPAPTVPAQPTVAGVPSPPIHHAAHKADTPTPVWLLALLAALAVVAAALGGLAWWFGWSPDRFARPFRASCGDLRERLSDLGLEFREWLRTGH
jgi:hypothetical protein